MALDIISGKLAQALLNLGELLAVIHRDGGHYMQEHGESKATEDAIRFVLDLRAENEHLAATACIHLWSLDAASDHDTAICGYDKLRAENEVLRADAERYRFIRAANVIELHAIERWLYEPSEELDAAIDALRGEGE